MNASRDSFLNTNRIAFFSVAFLLASLPSILFIDLLWRTGFEGLDLSLSILFMILMANIAWGATHAIIGFASRRRSSGHGVIESTVRDSSASDQPLPSVAIVLPVYNEDPQRVFAGLEAMYRSLQATGHGKSFDIFILSDSNKSEQWIKEEFAWATLCRDLGAFGRINYRRRKKNTDKKAGNLLEFCQDWGSRYRYMLTLDADSIMEGDDVIQLVRIMETNPKVGICQTAPRVVFGDSLWGRLQQFANRFYGPVFMAGLNFWQRGDGNYWGHNALIRLAPFIEYCALPDLPGREPFGGKILSHDFVEAALMRKAGFEVWLATELSGSYEEGPQDIIEHAKRDRRWCQGNLQHFWLLCSRALYPASRIHLANGIMSYASSFFWMLFLVLGGILAFNRERSHLSLLPVDSFSSVVDITIHQHAALVTFITLGLLFISKFLACVDNLMNYQRILRFGGIRKAFAGVALETLLSVFIAPIFMIYHSKFVISTALGRGVSWKTQKRGAGNGLHIRDALAGHFWHSAIGISVAMISIKISPAYFYWLTPIWIGLSIAPILSWILSKPYIGHFLKRHKILLTPEEHEELPALQTVKKILNPDRKTEPYQDSNDSLEGFKRTLVDPYANAIRATLAIGGDRKTVSPIILERAIHEGPSVLEEETRLEILNCTRCLVDLHDRIWTSDTRTLHRSWLPSLRQYTPNGLQHRNETPSQTGLYNA